LKDFLFSYAHIMHMMMTIKSFEGYDSFMKFIKKAAAVIAATSVALSLSACGADLSWAAKVGKDSTVPIGLYIYNQAVSYRTGVQNGQIDTTKGLEGQTVNVSDSDTSAVKHFDSEAIKAVKSCAGARVLATEMNIELTADELESVAQNTDSAYETDKDVFEKNGVAKSSVEEYYKDMTLKNKLFNAIYGKDGTEPVSDKELKQYIKENFATINFIQQYYYNDDGTEMSDAEKAKLKKQYEKIKSQSESGKIKFTDKCKEFEKNATSYKGGSTNYTMMWDISSEDGKKVMSLKEGEFTFLETDTVIILIQKAKIDYNGAGLKDSRDTLLIEYKYEEFVKNLIAKAESDKNVSFNQAAFDKFSSATRDFSAINIPTNGYSYY